MKKKKPKLISYYQNKLWELCKLIIRAKYSLYCFTCGRGPLEGSSCQTGHFIPKGSSPATLKYSLENLRIQCYHCNINLGGNGAVFYRKMVEKEGQKYVDRLFAMRNELVKADSIWYEKKIKEYQMILKNIC